MPWSDRKPRGWRRRARALDRWRDEEIALPDGAPGADYHSAELWFERWPWPWPLGIRRRMVAHLVTIHDHWLARMRERGEPSFYLGIWLFLPEVQESQVVLAGGWRGADYAGRHAVGERVPPPALHHGRPCDLERFAWSRVRHVDRYPITDYGEKEHRRVRRLATRVERTDEGEYVTFERESWYGWLPEVAALAPAKPASALEEDS